MPIEHLAGAVIDDVVFDAGVAEIRFSLLQLGEGDLAFWTYKLELAIARPHDDIIMLVAVPSGGSAARKAPIRYAQMIVVDMDHRSGHLLAHFPLPYRL